MTYIPNGAIISIIIKAEKGKRMATKEQKEYYRNKHLSPAEREEILHQTNFPTIAETKTEIKKVAERDLDNLGELYNIFQEICRGKDPEEVIRSDRVLTNRSFQEYRNMVEHVENAFGIIEEYRRDINTLKGRGQK